MWYDVDEEACLLTGGDPVKRKNSELDALDAREAKLHELLAALAVKRQTLKDQQHGATRRAILQRAAPARAEQIPQLQLQLQALHAQSDGVAAALLELQHADMEYQAMTLTSCDKTSLLEYIQGATRAAAKMKLTDTGLSQASASTNGGSIIFEVDGVAAYVPPFAIDGGTTFGQHTVDDTFSSVPFIASENVEAILRKIGATIIYKSAVARYMDDTLIGYSLRLREFGYRNTFRAEDHLGAPPP